MSKIDEIKGEITVLSDSERTQLKRWLDELDAETFDQKIDADISSGRLDSLIENARSNYRAGKRSPL